MTSDQSTFQRKEVKYRLDMAAYLALRERLGSRFAPDAPPAAPRATATAIQPCAPGAGGCIPSNATGAEPAFPNAPVAGLAPSRILSLYYDTPERALIVRSLEKPLYKEKIRLRSYGAPCEGSCIFVELKKKMRGIVYKRRVPLTLEAARLFMAGMPYEQACERAPFADAARQAEAHSAKNIQIAREIEAFQKRHAPLSPSMGIAVNRLALASNPALEGNPVRLTFDSDICYFDCRAAQFARCDVRSAADYRPLLAPGEVVMEVKVLGSYPLWLARIFAECGVRPCSFSKYGMAYKACQPSSFQGAESPAAHAMPLHTLEGRAASFGTHSFEEAACAEDFTRVEEAVRATA